MLNVPSEAALYVELEFYLVSGCFPMPVEIYAGTKTLKYLYISLILYLLSLWKNN